MREGFICHLILCSTILYFTLRMFAKEALLSIAIYSFDVSDVVSVAFLSLLICMLALYFANPRIINYVCQPNGWLKHYFHIFHHFLVSTPFPTFFFLLFHLFTWSRLKSQLGIRACRFIQGILEVHFLFSGWWLGVDLVAEVSSCGVRHERLQRCLHLLKIWSKEPFKIILDKYEALFFRIKWRWLEIQIFLYCVWVPLIFHEKYPVSYNKCFLCKVAPFSHNSRIPLLYRPRVSIKALGVITKRFA